VSVEFAWSGDDTTESKLAEKSCAAVKNLCLSAETKPHGQLAT